MGQVRSKTTLGSHRDYHWSYAWGLWRYRQSYPLGLHDIPPVQNDSADATETSIGTASAMLILQTNLNPTGSAHILDMSIPSLTGL
jgi:hypothetical protein